MPARHPTARVVAAATARACVDPLEGRRLFATVSLVAPLPALSTTDPNSAPSTLVRDSAGNLYGVDPQGGAGLYGTVFEVTPSTGVLTVLYTFDGTHGNGPTALAIDAAGDVFGITEGGDGSAYGTLFELPAADRTTPSFLYTFNNATIGTSPTTLLTDSAGDVDVLTSGGGANGGGTIVQFTAATGYATPTALGSLPTDSHVYADGLVLAPNGTLYGTTAGGGNSGQEGEGDGTLFSLPAGSSTVSTLAEFNDATTGTLPQGQLYVDGSDDVFGVTEQGAGTANFYGDVWEYTAATGTLSLAAGFNDTTYPGGSGPAGGVIGNGSGDLIGTTTQSNLTGSQGTGSGTVFSANPTTGAITELGSLTQATTGGTPDAGLTPDGSGDYYGVTSSGGANGRGAVFVVDTSATGTPTPTPTPTGTSTTGLTLTVAKSTAPTSLVAGAKLKGSVTVTVANATGAAIKSTGTVDLYATGTSGTSTLVGSVKHGLKLANGQSTPVTIAVRPLVLPAGTYTLLPTVTIGSDTSTAATGPSVDVAAANVALAAAVAAVTPATVAPGKAVTITLSLTNAGNVNSTGPATATITLATVGTGAVVTLPDMATKATVKLGGKPVLVHLKVKVPVGTAAGSYTPTVVFAQPLGSATAVGTTPFTVS